MWLLVRDWRIGSSVKVMVFFTRVMRPPPVLCGRSVLSVV